MSREPSTPEAWKEVRAKGLGDVFAQRLREGQVIEIAWMPPISILELKAGPSKPIPPDLSSPRYRFRIEYHEGERRWYVEGMGPQERGWLIVEGPMLSAGGGLAPYLAGKARL